MWPYSSDLGLNGAERLCHEVGCPRAEIVPGPVCRKCFQDLEKLTKAQNTADLGFFEYIRSTIMRAQLMLALQLSQVPQMADGSDQYWSERHQRPENHCS